MLAEGGEMKLHLYAIFLLVALPFSAVYAETVLTPLADTKLSLGRTYVYCPTFNKVWHRLKTAVGGDVTMVDQPDMVTALNAAPVVSNTIPPSAVVTFGGRVRAGMAADLQDRLHKKFGRAAPAIPPGMFGDQAALVAYCHLQRALPFPRRFMYSPKYFIRFKSEASDVKVQFFGATRGAAGDYSRQVEIVHWKDDDEFTLRLRTKRKGEYMVLAKMRQPASLATAAATLKKQLRDQEYGMIHVKINGNDESLMSVIGEGDMLAIPLINVDVATNFSAICQHKLTNAGFQDLHLSQAYQDVSFKLDATGARVRSTSYATADFGGPLSSSIPRKFVFDSPFLVTLWRENAPGPYLAIWVGSADLLLPFK
jgi:hypothetical protein